MINIVKSTMLAATLCAFSTLAQAQEAQIKPTSDAPILTMVNVLTPAKGMQGATIAQLQKALDTVLVSQPGFISGSIHRSLDSEHIVNYAQWENQESLMAFVAKLQSGDTPEMAKVFSLAQPDYHPYAVVSVHIPSQ